MRSPLIIPVALVAMGCATRPAPYSPPEISVTGRSFAEVAAEVSLTDPAPLLSSSVLADVAVLTNPDLKAMRAQAGLADAQVFAAGLVPDPIFGIGADFPLNGANEVIALAASLGLDLAGLSTRPGRLAAANANLSGVRQDILWAEWLTRQNAKLLATRIAWLETIKRKTAVYRRLADEDLRRAVAAASRGDIAALEVDARRLAAVDASDRDRSAENQLSLARLDLNRLLGIAPGELLGVAPPGQADREIPPAEALFASAIANRADLQGLRDRLRAAHAGLAIADASRFPLPGVTLNAARDTGNIRTVGPAVSFTLPAWNQARGERAVAGADLAVLEAQYEARAETIRADIGAAIAALDIARRQRTEVIRDLAGIADQAGRAEAAARRGDISQTSAAATRLAALDKEILADTLALTAAETGIALETAAGHPLDTF